MTDAKSAWREASDRFGSLGSKLKVHYEQQRGQESEEAKAEVKDALHRLSGALEDAFEAIGKAARDDAVKTDVKQVGQSLATALGATFSEVSGELQRAFSGHGGAGPSSTATGTEPTTTEPTTSTEPTTTVPSAAEPGAAEPGAADATGGDEGGSQPPKVEPWGTP